MAVDVQVLAAGRSDPSSTMADLMQPAWRQLVLVTCGVFLAVAVVAFPVREGWTNMALTALVIGSTALALWLSGRHWAQSHVLWHLAWAGVITLAVSAFRVREIALAYALLPLTAAVVAGWRGALLAEGLVGAMAGWLQSGRADIGLPVGYPVAVVVAGAFAGLLGWVITHSLITATEWSLRGYERSRQETEDARQQRMQLRQAQDDLMLANRELARLSERLKALHQAAQEARQAKEEFVANVSHELRTPLNMIIGFSEMIMRSPQMYSATLPPSLLADIGAIQRNSRHLAKLVDDVLDLSQVEAGRMALSREWVSVDEIVEAAATTVRALFESKGLYLERDVAADLPLLYADGTRLRQVLINLLSNAGRFTERGGVHLTAGHQGSEVVLTVRDTGPGIAPDDQQRLFEPFQQLDSSIRRRHGGSGLGLSISRRFVELHGGRMWLESEVGRGTAISFSVPVTSAQGSAAESGSYNPYSQYEARVRSQRTPLAPAVPRIVVVEEGNTLARLFGRYMDGAEVVPMRDVATARAELEREPAMALVVNALSLDEADRLASQLRDLPYGIPAISCCVPGMEEAALRLGVTRYLTKPVTRDTLLGALEEVGRAAESVLLVDDDPEVLQLFARMLSGADRGYRIMQASSGRRALAMLRERHPDVLLLDLIMPGMDGFEVLQRKSQDPTIRDIPVVIVSSRDPGGESIVSDTLSVTRAEGISAAELIACVRALSEVLAPQIRSGHRARPERPPE